MSHYQQNFHRQEKKYLINVEQYGKLMELIGEKMEYDTFGKYKICNLYFDTKQYDLIRNSISKPLYKEKFRLRSYGIPEMGSQVHLEIKKKYDGVVYKRRISMTYEDAVNYCINGIKPNMDNQIFREIDWFLKRYELYPMLYLSYDRMAMKGIENRDLRITFDNHLLWRTSQLDLTKGDFGHMKITQDRYIMEIKTDGGMPLWLSRILNELKIYPQSFSKYGHIYQEEMAKDDYKGRAILC